MEETVQKQSEETQNLPAVSKTDVMDISHRLRARSAQIETSLDLADPAQLEIAVNLMARVNIKLPFSESTTIKVVHWLLYEGATHANGEVMARIKGRVIDTEGTLYGWSSPATSDTFMALLAVKGHGPWPDGLPVRFEKHTSRDPQSQGDYFVCSFGMAEGSFKALVDATRKAAKKSTK